MINDFPIYCIRGEKDVVDTNLAKIYGVAVKRLNEQVKRNIKRFPSDFSFIVNKQEFTDMWSQIATTSRRRLSNPPRVFTEHGAIAAAMILNSEEAVAMSTYVVRAFVKLREMVASNHKLAAQFAELERQVEKHDKALVSVVQAIKQLLEPSKPKKKRSMGFISE